MQLNVGDFELSSAFHFLPSRRCLTLCVLGREDVMHSGPLSSRTAHGFTVSCRLLARLFSRVRFASLAGGGSCNGKELQEGDTGGGLKPD